MTSARLLAPHPFQFTHPGRGATRLVSIVYYPLMEFQFTHPERGATLASPTTLVISKVSIHAPREGCDLFSGIEVTHHRRFQFTHPERGATLRRSISIGKIWSFNSRTPRGVRRRSS